MVSFDLKVVTVYDSLYTLIEHTSTNNTLSDKFCEEPFFPDDVRVKFVIKNAEPSLMFIRAGGSQLPNKFNNVFYNSQIFLLYPLTAFMIDYICHLPNYRSFPSYTY